MTVQTKHLMWRDDVDNEALARRVEAKWQIATIRFSEIDLDASKDNYARLGKPLLEDRIESYVTNMRQGDMFPRCAAYRMKNGRYMIVWGNQRCNAVACRIKRHELPADLEMEVYLFGSEDEMALDLLTRFGNRANGEPVSRQAAIEHAVYAHQKWQVSIEDAAKLAGVSSNAISERLRARETEKRLVETGKRPDLIPMTTQAAMATILNHESAFDKVAELVIRHRPSSARVERLVAKIKKSNAAGRVVAIKDFETECRTELKPAVRSNGQISRPQSVRCFQHFRSLVAFLEAGKRGEAFQKLVEMQIVLGSDNETELRKLAKRLKFRLKVLGL